MTSSTHRKPTARGTHRGLRCTAPAAAVGCLALGVLGTTAALADDLPSASRGASPTSQEASPPSASPAVADPSGTTNPPTGSPAPDPTEGGTPTGSAEPTAPTTATPAPSTTPTPGSTDSPVPSPTTTASSQPTSTPEPTSSPEPTQEPSPGPSTARPTDSPRPSTTTPAPPAQTGDPGAGATATTRPGAGAGTGAVPGRGPGAGSDPVTGEGGGTGQSPTASGTPQAPGVHGGVGGWGDQREHRSGLSGVSGWVDYYLQGKEEEPQDRAPAADSQANAGALQDGRSAGETDVAGQSSTREDGLAGLRGPVPLIVFSVLALGGVALVVSRSARALARRDDAA